MGLGENDQASLSIHRRSCSRLNSDSLDALDCFVIDQIWEAKMTHRKSKLNTNEIPAFRKFLEARGFKCRDGKGDWQSMQVQSIDDRGWSAFCFNTKGVVTSPVEFDALIQVFRAPVDPSPAVEVIDRPASHDSDLLDDFAIAALQGICAHQDTWGLDSKGIVQKSYELALLAMAERAKHQPK